MKSILQWLCLFALAGCGTSSGDGGSGGTSADLIAELGPPTMFSVECSRYAYDVATDMWVPQPGFVRIDTWMYPGQVNVIVNGEVLRRASMDTDISSYPEPGIDPRQYGCGEAVATVESILGVPTVTTGTELVSEDLDVVSSYYNVNANQSGLQVLYRNGKLVGMASL